MLLNYFNFTILKSAVLVMMTIAFIGCSDSPAGPDEEPGDPVEISWTPLQAQNQEMYRPTISISGGAGFRQINVQRAGWDTTLSVSGATVTKTIDDFLDFSRSDLPKDVTYTVMAIQTSGDQTSQNFDVSVDYTNQAPKATITTEERVFTEQVLLEIHFTDDHGLESAFLVVEGVRYDFDVQGKTSKQTTINHPLSSTGIIEWFGEVIDDEGQATSFSGELYKVPTYSFKIGARGFYDKAMDRELSLTIRNLELGEEHKLKADQSGVISAQLFEGPHVISDVEGQYYPIGRMRVDKDIYGDDRQFNAGENFTYIVTGIEQTPWLINLTKDLNPNEFYIETVDRNTNPYTGEDLVENLSRLMRYDYIVVPRRSMAQTIVFNYGNPDWPEGFDIWDDFVLNDDIPAGKDAKYLPGEGRYPPGYTFTQEGIDNFNAFIEDLMTRIYESDIGDINPYEVQVVKDTAENLTDFYQWGAPYFLTLNHNVHFIAGNAPSGKGGLESINVQGSTAAGTQFINYTSMLVSGISTGLNKSNTWFSNERNLTGTTDEASPPVCSVKDTGASQLRETTNAEYCYQVFTTPDRSSLKPIDILADNLFVHIGGWSELQPNKSYFNKSDEQIMQAMWNTTPAEEGFNVWLVNYP